MGSFSPLIQSGEEKLGLSLKNLLLMTLVPLSAVVLLGILVGLFLWKVSQSRKRQMQFGHGDLGDMDFILKASMAGDSTLEVSRCQDQSHSCLPIQTPFRPLKPPCFLQVQLPRSPYWGWGRERERAKGGYWQEGLQIPS